MISVGNNNIDEIKIGSQPIKQVYVGSELAFDNDILTICKDGKFNHKYWTATGWMTGDTTYPVTFTEENGYTVITFNANIANVVGTVDLRVVALVNSPLKQKWGSRFVRKTLTNSDCTMSYQVNTPIPPTPAFYFRYFDHSETFVTGPHQSSKYEETRSFSDIIFYGPPTPVSSLYYIIGCRVACYGFVNRQINAKMQLKLKDLYFHD